jgi:hypothetical protein
MISSIRTLAGRVAILRAGFLLPLLYAASASPTKADDMVVKAPPVPQSSDWQFMLDEDTRFYTWSGTRGFPALPLGPSGSGAQVYTPVSFDALGKTSQVDKWEVQMQSAYVWSNQSTPGQTGSFSELTDTTTAATYTYLGFNGVQPYASLALNLPTGHSALFGAAPNGRMDPDLVGIAVSGQGFNVGPTIGANVPIGQSWMFGSAAGYTYKGQYTKDTFSLLNPATLTPFTGPTANLKPGDDYTVTATAAYSQGALFTRVNASATFETTTSVSGILGLVPYSGPFYRSGNSYQVTSATSYAWSKTWTSILVATYGHTDPNQVLAANLPPLVTQLFNANTDAYQVTFNNKFQVRSDLMVGPTLGFLDRPNNSWVSTSNQFIAAKTKWTAGAFATYDVLKGLAINARLEHYWINEGSDPGLTLPSIADSGWLASLGATYKW